MVLLMAITVSSVTMVIGIQAFRTASEAQYKERARDLARTVSRLLDVEKAAALADEVMMVYDSVPEKVASEEWGSPAFNSYVDNYRAIGELQCYRDLLEYLREVDDANTVDCLYLLLVDPEEKNCIYMVDSDREEPCPIGCIDRVYSFNEGVLIDPYVGFPAYLTNTEEYGWLVTAGEAVLDASGSVVCYAMADINMTTIMDATRAFRNRLINLLVLITLVIVLVSYWYVSISLVRPVKALTRAASRYVGSKGESRGSFKDVRINTHDEIRTLHRSMVQMEKDIDDYISNLKETREELDYSRSQAMMYNDLASHDALTGVGSDTAYRSAKSELEKQKRENDVMRFGIVMVDANNLKRINDSFGHEYGDIYLKNICRLVSDVFRNSEVFRIGGDEFAVILTEHGELDSIEGLVEKFSIETERYFNNEILDIWDRPWAAIGFAVFDPSFDESVNDVFKRADRSMYENKAIEKRAHGF